MADNTFYEPGWGAEIAKEIERQKAKAIYEPTPYAPAPTQPTYTPAPVMSYPAGYLAPRTYNVTPQQVVQSLPTAQAYTPAPAQPAWSGSGVTGFTPATGWGSQAPWGITSPTVPTTPTKPQSAMTSLTDTRKKYLGEIITPKPAYGAEQIPAEVTPSMEGKQRKGVATVLPEKEFWASVAATPGKEMHGGVQAMFEQPELIFKQPMTKFTGGELPTYWDVAQSSNQIGAAATRIAEGVQMGVTDLPSVGNLIETKANDNQISVLTSAFKKLIDAGGLATGSLPPISDNRLNNIADHDVMKNVWDTGYKASAVINFSTQTITDFYNQMGIPLYGVESDEQLQQIDYMSLINVLYDLSGQGKFSLSDFKRMKEEGKTLRLNTSTKGLDGLGNKLFSASLETDVPFEPKKKKEEQTEAEYWTEWQKDYNHYWDPRQVAQRNSQREDSWQWSRNKELEGWAEYYGVLDKLKLAPFANEFFDSPTQFNDLRRRWETTSGKSWEQFLKDYDFISHWYQQRPTERGERPAAFAPALTAVSRL